LIGVPTGEISGLAVIDIDPRHGGETWLDNYLTSPAMTELRRLKTPSLPV
jgi:hypothetical protein